MATLVVQQPPFRQSRTPPPGLSLDASKFKTAAIPNKHIPYCSPGPAPSSQPRTPATPPLTPLTKQRLSALSILHPASTFTKAVADPPVFSIDALILSRAQDDVATNALPDPRLVFPWLHGLHPENQIQMAFFLSRRKAMKKTPSCMRGITLVKAGGDLSKSKLKGAISPAEILAPTGAKDPMFFDVDPKDGFSVRNFHIQVAKLAMVSDIVIYKDAATKEEELYNVAKRFSKAQSRFRAKNPNCEAPECSTFVVTSPFSEFEERFPELVAVDSSGQDTGKVIDFFQLERREMCTMSKPSEIANNVWLGPTPDSTVVIAEDSEDEYPDFDIFVETSDLARSPESHVLAQAAEDSSTSPQSVEFASSGSIMPPTWSHAEVDGLLDMCHWIYGQANQGLSYDSREKMEEEGETDDEEEDEDGDIQMKLLIPRSKRILIHCADGYTESSLLAIAYFMFAECLPVHEAWVRLHCEKERNFFAYPSDVALLTAIQPRLMQESPRSQGAIPSSLPEEPSWLRRLDGSLPSRILPYMYLGNLNHANNPELLAVLGIKRVLSVGEPVGWTQDDLESWGPGNLMYIDKVQDNGVDPLTEEFVRCLEFIEKGKLDGTATLVHCRVGVSRSATICIAEVMSSLGYCFPRAYCFVRARRLNVIIQPHLRFAYELLKWDEVQQVKRGQPLRRELEWASIAREIAAMNKPYTR